MDWGKKSFMILDGDSRQCLPVIRGISNIGAKVTTLNASKLSNGYTSKFPSSRLVKPKNEDLYEFLLKEVRKKRYDVIIPLSDASTDVVTQHYEELCKYVSMPIPNRKVFLNAYNKQNTMRVCTEIGVPCPITKMDDEKLDDALKRIGFPLIAKPRMACGSKGLKIIKNKSQLKKMIEKHEIRIEEYVIQEFVPQTGKQYNIHLFMNDQKKLCSGVVTEKSRWYPIDGGASCLCRTVVNEKILNNCEKLLKAIDWRGYCEIEMIEDPRDGECKVMEINGRASASIKIMQLAGVDIGKQMAQLACGCSVTEYDSYPNDVRMRRLVTDILWLIQSPDRFSRKPFWFSPLRTHEVVFSIDDPKPFFASVLDLLMHIGRFRTEMKKRKRG
jgi:predicted ATP-grasp superfamily ATP-dependent carboligase